MSVHLLSMDKVKPEWSKTRQVELVEGYVYCLLPSIRTEDGFARLYPSMPGFVRDLPWHHHLGKVGTCMILNDIEYKIKRFLEMDHCLWISLLKTSLQRYR